MIGLHITGDNREIPIVCMDDNHLINTIKLRIAKPIERYQTSILIDDRTQFHYGKSIKKVEKPDEKALVSNSIWYISEGLRRDSTREAILSILGKLNTDWGIPCAVSLNLTQISQVASNDDDDIDYMGSGLDYNDLY